VTSERVRGRSEPQSRAAPWPASTSTPQSSQQNTTSWSTTTSTTTARPPLKAPVRRQLTIDDFFHPPQSVSLPPDSGRNISDDELPSEFTSPPLLPALRKSLMETLGPFAHPPPIQSLSLKWIVQESQDLPSEQPNWRQFFLASETGSGKSFAYLLPLLQSIKQAELAEKGKHRSQSHPRGCITHEH
jgi:hypothetical protein